MVKRIIKRIPKDEKIQDAIKNPILESKNKNYGKIKHAGKITYTSTDKKTNVTKELSAKQFRTLKKIIKIKQHSVILASAFYKTNQDLKKGIETKTSLYKKYTDDKGKVKFLVVDTSTFEITKSITFKKGMSIFRAAKRERDITEIMTKKGLNKKDARKVWIDKQEYLKENQIGQIMLSERKDRVEAIKFRNNLIQRGRMDTLIGSYTKFNPDSAYNTVVKFV